MEAVLDRSVPRPRPSLGKAHWAGLAATTLAVLFLVFDSVIKVLKLPVAMDATTQLGYPASAVAVIGLIELVCLATYLVPRSAVVGAVLLTGYLGGAVASQLRAGNPLFSHTLFPLYVAALIWGGLYLRDGRVRALLARR
jgi:DoxX-like family